MQVINSPGQILLGGNSAISTNIVLVTAALNIRGVIIQEVTTRFMLQALNSSAGLNISGVGGLRQSHAVFDLNGGAGPVNVPLGYTNVKEVQYPAGNDIILQITVGGIALIAYSIVGKIL